MVDEFDKIWLVFDTNRQKFRKFRQLTLLRHVKINFAQFVDAAHIIIIGTDFRIASHFM